jgi:hypothetical protein
MRALSAAEILRVWELGVHRAPLDRGLLLLAAAAPEAAPEALASLSLGSRDRRLLELRARTFGDEVELFARCPACQEAVELAVQASALLGGGEREKAAAAREPRVLETASAVIKYRLPNSRDLAAVAGSPDAERLLVGRCVLEVSLEGRTIAPDALPEPLREALGAAMAEADPHAEISLAMGCPSCGHRWAMLFDVLTVLWSDVTRHARRLLQEVDALARVYGWGEEEVLSLSAERRALYLEMALS